jgi:hypothetical protein
MEQKRMMTLVQPFYLAFMGCNVDEEQVRLIPELVRVARDTSPEEIVALLRGPWRESLMGAWYSLFHDPKAVGEELLKSLRSSLGILNACALMVVAVEVVGVEATPSIRLYAKNAYANGWGGEGFSLAALQHLDQLEDGELPTARNCAGFAALLNVARTLQSASEPFAGSKVRSISRPLGRFRGQIAMAEDFNETPADVTISLDKPLC